MSFVVLVRAVGESSFNSNGLRFPTRESADSWAFSLMCRWFGAEEYRIEESPDAVNVSPDGSLLKE